MLVISYDIADNKLRNRFSKMLTRSGAIRLQYSVYEFNNTRRLISNLEIQIKEKFMPLFSGGDSVMIFNCDNNDVIKYGNAIHRDKNVVFL